MYRRSFSGFAKRNRGRSPRRKKCAVWQQHSAAQAAGSAVQTGDIEIKFTRNKTDNLLTKTQGLQNQLEAGIHPRIAIANCGLYSDPEQVFLDSEEYLKKWIVTEEQTADVANVDGELEAILNKLGAEQAAAEAE